MIFLCGKQYVPNYFPDGTLHLECGLSEKNIEIEWRYESNEEMITLYFLVNHMREALKADVITLYLPYIPNARMDRVKINSEVFTLKYFCRFINDLNFSRVVVCDPHSNVSLALLNNVESVNIQPKIKSLSEELLVNDSDILFFPDEGSSKRYHEYFQRKYLFGIKKRDWKTGKILDLDIAGDMPDKNFNALMIDDICSYGGTFFHSAKRLKQLGAQKIWLYVTHCENNVLNGELISSGLIDRIYTTRSIYTAEHPMIEVIEV